ncbi:hypothetical protein KKF05_01225 [Patescibacteria group bacterium]|nr:hypothetical protein [Patescibacteria group bacterium]MBU1029258.1 hypothetical protein [Patescibacteria group bacterium]MBU1915917.1 hypothetical protein [Patescibacteria group bacterium]
MERQLLAEGKTKRVWADSADPDLVVIESKDDLTAGDGAKHDVLSGKAVQATQTACNVFRHLQSCGLESALIKSAFIKQLSETSFYKISNSFLDFCLTKPKNSGSII